MNSKLDHTYGRYKSQLAGLLQKSQALECQLDGLSDEIARIETAICALCEAGATDSKNGEPSAGNDEVESTRDQLSVTEAEDNSDAAFGALTQRVFEVVNSLKPEEILRRSQIQERLTQQGHGPKGDYARTTLFRTLQRLRKQGRIGARKVDGEWYFLSANPPPA